MLWSSNSRKKNPPYTSLKKKNSPLSERAKNMQQNITLNKTNFNMKQILMCMASIFTPFTPPLVSRKPKFLTASYISDLLFWNMAQRNTFKIYLSRYPSGSLWTKPWRQTGKLYNAQWLPTTEKKVEILLWGVSGTICSTLLVEKTDRSNRLCVDIRFLNNEPQSMPKWTLPRSSCIAAVLCEVGNS